MKDGQQAVTTSLKRLEAAGYLRRIRRRTDGGKLTRYDWIISDPGCSDQAEGAVSGGVPDARPETEALTPSLPPAVKAPAKRDDLFHMPDLPLQRPSRKIDRGVVNPRPELISALAPSELIAPTRPTRPLRRRPIYLYRYFDAHGVLLYVGITNSPVLRDEQHREKSVFMTFAVVERPIERYPSRAKAEAAELAAIAKERPIFNLRDTDIDRQSEIIAEYLADAGRTDLLQRALRTAFNEAYIAVPRGADPL